MRLAGLAAFAVAAAIAATTFVSPASSQSGYYGQRATQDRDYSRMQSATQRAYGKTNKVTLKAKKKKRHNKAKHKRHHH